MIKNKKFQILSFDGGGIKGIFSIAFLTKLQKDLKIDNIMQHFDMVAGTSTGGIIALGLASGLSSEEILNFYLKDGKHIFKKIKLFSELKRCLWCPKFSNKPLTEALKDRFGDKLLKDSERIVTIPYYNATENKPSVFKTPHHKDLFADGELPMYEIALATSAAPTYFPIHNYKNKKFIDGGIVANNPTMTAILEAICFLNIDLNNISVLNISTTTQEKSFEKLSNSCGLKWARNIADLFMDAQGKTIAEQAKLLLQDNYLRIDVNVPKGFTDIDDFNSKERLILKADYKSQICAKEIKNKFCNHIANKFIYNENK